MTGRTVGMTLGKYAPLHHGHQQVIELALAECDQVIVMIYDCPETTNVPLPVRAEWIRQLYPQVEVVEAWDGPLEVGDAPEIMQMHDRYIVKMLGDQGITHFYSSEFYGDHVSRALGAVNRQVDPQRTTTPISATAIREDAYFNRQFLHPVVYRDLIANIVLLGAPSTGKTTLAAALAAELNTVWMPEYGREYWDAHQSERRLTPEQLVEIAVGHLEREETLLLEANRFLFTDTNALTTYVFSHYYHGAAAAKLAEYADRCGSRYDLTLLCDTDIPYDDTWDRSGDANRQVMQAQIKADLAMRKIPYWTVRGTLEERVEQVKGALAHFVKYQNPVDFNLKRDADERLR
ncbi:AAA family ATPase [Blastopirellula marina]|uniref:Cytidyltransferase n=1 Tax=Blastopirellula marina TaxID=124 RepID=A0A2S8GF70_9BACT|nr:AAA family ATPase [Blastopirellula marina]PQO43115.1 cytidyltransferase [Blastopirellula marina]